MNNCVQLPFLIPDFATHHNTAIVGMAYANKPHASVQALNQCMELICERDFLNGYSSPKLKVPDANLFTFPNIDRHCVSMIYAHQFYHEIIREMINSGSYIYLSCVDDYYLPGKSWYHEKHRIHDAILCGYDDTDNTFTLAAYDNNWMFRPIRIPQESYAESIHYALQEGNNVRLTALVVQDQKIELDTNLILNKIKNYVTSDLHKYPTTGTGNITGLAVHDYLNIYFEKLLDQSIPHDTMDWRILRIVWEYRTCMQKRIKAIEEKMELGNDISNAYSKILKENDRLRMLYAIYHKKPKTSLMLSIKEGMNYLKEAEKKELYALIKQMEEKVL